MHRRGPTQGMETEVRAADAEEEKRTSADERESKLLSKGAISSSAATKSLNLSLGGLFVLAIVYAPLVWLARRSMYQEHVVPLPRSAPLDNFSEERAMQHVWKLAGEIGGRQEGSAGLEQAFVYLKHELQTLKDRSSSDIRLEIDETLVNGSFNMVFLRHGISTSYRNHKNVAVRVSAAGTEEGAAVLVNGHLDGPLGSPGAADCASCVAAMLEVLRYIVDVNWVPPSPIIFLFNGAEELFCLGAHGFMTTHKWRDSLGAVINIEATGSSGPDLVVQSGPGSWPSRVYAESAVYPMANSAAQDIFPFIPGDTDYRMFSQDFGDVPGLDVVFLLNGYSYHTAYDRPENMVPGSLQARGQNLISLLRGFTSAPELKSAKERALQSGPAELRPVFFDLFGQWMVCYSQKVAMALHLLPLGVVLLVPSLTSPSQGAKSTITARFQSILVGGLAQACGAILAILFPVVLAILRLSASATAMTWFAQPWLAYLMFVPVSVVGLLVPRAIWLGQRASSDGEQNEVDWSTHWGAVGLNALWAAMGTVIGFGSGYLNFAWALFMLPALSIFRAFQGMFGRDSLMALLGYIIPGLLPAAYVCYYGGLAIQFITEKMGMSGTFPQPYAFYVADVILAAIIGIFVGLAVGPFIPMLGHWIAKPPAIRLLLYISIGAAALSSQMFPYSNGAPKRVVMTHTFRTRGPTEVLRSSYEFATIDPNSMAFVWKHAPEVVKALDIDVKKQSVGDSDPNVFLALYPISRLFTRSMEIPGGVVSSKPHIPLPHLSVVKAEQEGLQETPKQGSPTRRVHLEIDLGGLQEVWSTVMNITGPLMSWSFAEQQLSAAETISGGPASYICRLTGPASGSHWRFWIEANSSDPVRIELGVLDQHLDAETQRLVGLFPSWVAVVAGSTFISTYFV